MAARYAGQDNALEQPSVHQPRPVSGSTATLAPPGGLQGTMVSCRGRDLSQFPAICSRAVLVVTSKARATGRPRCMRVA
jgi:hypothetical protein